MSGTTPPNNGQHRAQTPAANADQSAPTQSSSEQNTIPITDVQQAQSQTPSTVTAQPAATSAQSSTLAGLLAAPAASSYNGLNPAVLNNCSEYCISWLTQGAWQLNPNLYVYQNIDAQVDLTEALYMAGELPLNIHTADPARHGVIVSYDGYDENSLRRFIQHNLNQTERYIIRTGSAGENGGHYGVLNFVPGSGWFMHDSIFGDRQMTDQTGHLTSSGRALLAPLAQWGPENGQQSLIFIQMTPRRIHFLAEFLLRYRYYGSRIAGQHAQAFGQTGSFPQRPPHAQLAQFPAALAIPSDLAAMQHATQAAIPRPSNSLMLSNRSADMALMGLDMLDNTRGFEYRFTLSSTNALQTSNIDILSLLQRAAEIQGFNQVGVRTGRQDFSFSEPQALSAALNNVDPSLFYFLRIGANNAYGTQYAFRFVTSISTGLAIGWHIYTRVFPYRGRAQDTWVLFADPNGNLSQDALALLQSHGASWGHLPNQLSIQLIEATPPRRQLLQSYVQYYRNISEAASDSLLEQHRLRLIQTSAATASTSATTALSDQAGQAAASQAAQHLIASFESLSRSRREAFQVDQTAYISDLDEFYSDLVDTLGADLASSAAPSTSTAPSAQALPTAPQAPISVPSQVLPARFRLEQRTSPLSSQDIARQIQLLDAAVQNSHESAINKLKFQAMRMFYKGIPKNEIVKKMQELSNQAGLPLLSWNLETLDLMCNYYHLGGVLQLRGFALEDNRQRLPAAAMRNLIITLQYNLSYEIPHLQRRIDAWYHQNASLIPNLGNPPSTNQLEAIVARLGYHRTYLYSARVSLQWRLRPNLTPTASEDIPALHLVEITQTRKRPASSSIESVLKKRKESTELIEALVEINMLNQLYDRQLIERQLERVEEAIAQESDATEIFKLHIIKLALEGNNFTQIQLLCRDLVAKKIISPMPLSASSFKLMLRYYLLGGLRLLRGFSLIHTRSYSPEVMHYILERISSRQRVTLRELHDEVTAGVQLGQFRANAVIPSFSVIRVFIERCGFYFDHNLNAWVIRDNNAP